MHRHWTIRAVRMLALALVLSFLTSIGAPLARALSTDPLDLLLQSQSWCGTGAESGSSAHLPGGERKPAPHGTDKHCPLCSQHYQPFVACASFAAAPALPVLRDGLPARFELAPRVQHVWRAALSRGPPRFS